MSVSAIAHATRDNKKTKGLTISDADLASFPSKRKKMDLYYDSRTGNFTYTDWKSKYIVHPNYSIKLANRKKESGEFYYSTEIR